MEARKERMRAKGSRFIANQPVVRPVLPVCKVC